MASKKRRRIVAFVAVAASVGGAVGVAAFNGFTEYTNTTEFCTSCHEMRAPVYEEYQKTAHFNNRSGVRVGCNDCRVAKEQPAKLVAKIRALDDLFAHLVGTVDTPEKFERKRLEMAETVWKRMEATDSRECRTCHTFEAMDLEQQARRARRKHSDATQDGKTCIDCHKGIAHTLPAGYDADLE